MKPLAPVDPHDFFALASELGMVDEATATDLRQESQATSLDPAKVAQRRGAMNAVQIDIVETLRRPREVAPGYEIVSVIGHGGMGVVYRALQLNLNRPVALKTVLLSQMNDPNFAARFEQEALAVGRLRHPNIIAAYDFGRHEGRLFLAMELFEGEDADGRVRRRGPFSPSQALGVARQAASGLAHAAQAGIVHRDVKPANLLLAPAPEGFQTPAASPMVKIADFGLAFLEEKSDARHRLTGTHSVIGSPHYMAPEQLGGEPIDFRTDIYALGATLWHLIAGEPPFNESAVSKIVVRKLSQEAPSLRSVCPSVAVETDRLIARMLSRRPEDRFESYQQLLAAIDERLAGADLHKPYEKAGAAPPATSLFDGKALAAAETALVPQAKLDSAPIGEAPAKKSAAFALTGRRKKLALASALLFVITVVVFSLVYAFTHRPLPKDRVLVASGRSASLFDGRSLQGWAIESGAWRVERTKEGSVLSGDSGAVHRTAAIPADPKPLKHFRLIFLVRRQQAEAIEIRFGERDRGRSHVLRIDAATTRLGMRDGVREPFRSSERSRPLLKTAADAAHVVHLERQRDNWWVFVDERLAGIALGADEEAPYFSFASEGGPAHFSDVAIEELTSAVSTPARR